eukprot:1159623-Pelagomonas_calceolata.AAC.2
MARCAALLHKWRRQPQSMRCDWCCIDVQMTTHLQCLLWRNGAIRTLQCSKQAHGVAMALFGAAAPLRGMMRQWQCSVLQHLCGMHLAMQQAGTWCGSGSV